MANSIVYTGVLMHGELKYIGEPRLGLQKGILSHLRHSMRNFRGTRMHVMINKMGVGRLVWLPLRMLSRQTTKAERLRAK